MNIETFASCLLENRRSIGIGAIITGTITSHPRGLESAGSQLIDR
jgi:hypothetical protein